MSDVIEPLTEEECYLLAILTDPSGLDQAEFLWVNEEEEDNCFRAWAFQWPWWRCMDIKQIDQAGRSVGKSESIAVRACAFPFVHPGQEMVLTAPEGVHLDAITDKVETRLLQVRLTKEMLVKGRGGIKHRPFHVNFSNGARIMGRIPQRDGKGMKGTHPVWLELDEGQDYPEAGWTEILETLKHGSKGAVWRVHGVTRGMRDHFWKYTQPDSGWRIHRITAMHRPTWSEEERESKLRDYGGSRENPEYRRNVYGLHGDMTNPLFVLHRLMACVDKQLGDDYNSVEYQYMSLNHELIEDNNGNILDFLNFPMEHLKYKNFWVGMDVGYTHDPSEILVWAETKERAIDSEPEEIKRRRGKPVPDKELNERASALKLLTRIKLERVHHGLQMDAILWVLRFYKPQAFCMDKTGLGLPLYQNLQERAKEANADAKATYTYAMDTIKGYGFSEKILVDIDESIEVDEWVGDLVKDAGINANVLEYSTDVLRKLVDDQRIILPIRDKPLLGEFQGQTFTFEKSNMDMYGRRRNFSKGSFHALDASRMAVLGYAQHAIDLLVKKEKFVGVQPIFLY